MSYMDQLTKGIAEDSQEGRELIARARRLEDASDRAFRRYMNGDVVSSSGAASLRSRADEAWADVRFRVIDGARIEAEGLSA